MEPDKSKEKASQFKRKLAISLGFFVLGNMILIGTALLMPNLGEHYDDYPVIVLILSLFLLPAFLLVGVVALMLGITTFVYGYSVRNHISKKLGYINWLALGIPFAPFVLLFYSTASNQSGREEALQSHGDSRKNVPAQLVTEPVPKMFPEPLQKKLNE